MRASCLLLLLAAVVSLAGPPLSGPAEIPRDTVGVLEVKPKGTLKLAVPAGLSVVKTPQAWYVAGKPGTYRFTGEDFWIDWDARQFGSEPVDYTLTVTGDAGPAPPPPGPGPPPEPDPSARTNPFLDDTARVLIVFDPNQTLGITEHSVIYGAQARAAMEAFAGKGADGEPERRIWTKATVPDGEADAWKAAMGRARKSYPWLLVGKGAAGYEGPLPKTVQEFVDLLAKHK